VNNHVREANFAGSVKEEINILRTVQALKDTQLEVNWMTRVCSKNLESLLQPMSQHHDLHASSQCKTLNWLI